MSRSQPILSAPMILATLAAVVLLPVPPVQAATPAVAAVRYIDHGITIQHLHQSKRAGHLKDPVYGADNLLTGRNQRASIGFHDGTVLQLNQNTDATITAHRSQVRKGEVAEIVAPGTDHQVQTASAVASSVGTAYDVTTDGSTSVFVVLHGALRVSNALGAVTVKTNQQTTVPPNHAPLPPVPADAKRVFDWTAGIPTPDIGEDIALDAEGGQVAAVSSQREGPGDTGHVQHINDGLLSTGWESARGKATNQTVTMGFRGGNFYRISAVIIDPAATYGDPSSEDLKDFAIRISSTGTDDASFTTVYEGHCQRADRLQTFTFPVPMRARYVQLVAQSNYGSTERVAVAEWEVVATASVFAQPRGIVVAPNGTVYVADGNGNRIDVLNRQGKMIRWWGKKGSKPGDFLSPSALALDRAGNVFVTDTNNSRVQKFSPTGKLLARFGTAGLGDGEFQSPEGIAVDRHGNMYVGDTAARIQKLSPSGKVLAVWRPDALNRATGLAVDGHDNLYAADYVSGSVLKLAPSGTVVQTYTLPAPAQNLDAFFQVFRGQTHEEQLALGANGTIYVADTYNNRVLRINSGGHVTVWGQYGDGRGEFFLPGGIAVDGDGNVYVADTHNSRIQKLWSIDGRVLSVWGKYATVPQVLGQPGGLAIDPHGNVWVTDSLNDRVQVRSGTTGHVLAVFGHHGFPASEQGTLGLGQFYYPLGVAIDTQGEVYIADGVNSRIEELAPRGPIGSFGGFGMDPGKFALTFDVALGPQDKIYVADIVNDRIQIFAHAGQNQHELLQVINLKNMLAGFNSFYPERIAVDHEGNIYVDSAAFDNRIVKISPAGALVAVFGENAGPPASPGDSFTFPTGLFVDRQDHLWVCDTNDGAIHELSTDGTPLASFTEPGANPSPWAVTVDRHGYVYVADVFNGDIFKFSPKGKVVGRWG